MLARLTVSSFDERRGMIGPGRLKGVPAQS